MDPRDLSDDDLDQLAQQLAGRLPSGTHGDRVVLSRRQFALAASGVLSAGALMALGVDEASAQAAAGQVGTPSSPVDAFTYDLDVANAVTSSLPMNGNDIENAGAVSVGELGNDGSGVQLKDQLHHFPTATGTTHRVDLISEDGTIGSGNFTAGESVQFTEGVGTTSTQIIDTIDFGASICLVAGNDGPNEFADLVMTLAGGIVTTIESLERRTPATRTYSAGLDLEMGSGPYNVTAIELGGGEQAEV